MLTDTFTRSWIAPFISFASNVCQIIKQCSPEWTVRQFRCGAFRLDSVDLPFILRLVEQLLRARNVVAHRAHKAAERFRIVAVRKRLGLTKNRWRIP